MELPERKLFENPDHFHIDCCTVAEDVELLAWASQHLWTDTEGTPDHPASARLAILCMEIIQCWMKQLDQAAVRMDRITAGKPIDSSTRTDRRNADR